MKYPCGNIDCDFHIPGRFSGCTKYDLEVAQSCPEFSPGQRWSLGEVHHFYGEVTGIGFLSGEEYRWFTKDNLVTMIPLSFI